MPKKNLRRCERWLPARFPFSTTKKILIKKIRVANTGMLNEDNGSIVNTVQPKCLLWALLNTDWSSESSILQEKDTKLDTRLSGIKLPLHKITVQWQNTNNSQATIGIVYFTQKCSIQFIKIYCFCIFHTRQNISQYLSHSTFLAMPLLVDFDEQLTLATAVPNITFTFQRGHWFTTISPVTQYLTWDASPCSCPLATPLAKQLKCPTRPFQAASSAVQPAVLL